MFDISQIVKEYGVKNIRIFGPGTKFDSVGPTFLGIKVKSYDDEQFRTEFEIIEDQWRVEEKYKITLVAIDKFQFGKEIFYQSDFNHSINIGVFHVYVLTPDGYMPVCVNVEDIICQQEAKLIKWFSNLDVFKKFRLIQKPV